MSRRKRWPISKIAVILLLQTIGSLAVELVVTPGAWGRISRYRSGGVLVEYWTGSDKVCSSYVLLPAESMWHPVVRSILYFCGLVYMFVGISIFADVFMASIEKITSTKVKTVINEDGPCTIRVSIWNPTVANLTLLALGSSAPEILLSVIEAVTTLDSKPGELGPSTIVGSASFNLLVISAICVTAVKEPKRISEFSVFLLTATASLLAYLWMIVTLSIWTPCEITILESVLTLLMFPVLVGVAFLQDRKRKTSTCDENGNINVHRNSKVVATEILSEYESPRPDKARRIWELLKGESKDKSDIAGSVEKELSKIQNPLVPGGFTELGKIGNASPPITPLDSLHDSLFSTGSTPTAPLQPVLEWEMQYFSKESDNTVNLCLIRHGPDDTTVTAKYEAQPVTAQRDVDYSIGTGHVIVEKGKCKGYLKINIIRNVTEALTFNVTLKSAGGGASLGHVLQATVCVCTMQSELRFVPAWSPNCKYPSLVKGVICLEVPENAKTIPIVVGRNGSANDAATCLIKTVSVTAENGIDYVAIDKELSFPKGVRTVTTALQLIDTKSFEKRKILEIRLGSVHGSRIALSNSIHMAITEDLFTKKFVNRAIENLPRFSVQGLAPQTWSARFRDAVSASSDMTSGECATYFATLLWRVMSAFIPPVQYAGGWVTFVVALSFIGLVTAIVAELASLFGCVIGLRDPVTAITFVALGTSLPDTFASKTVAEEDDNADAAIGNVTGSNCVNVFLGLGIPWLISSIYKTAKGKTYNYPAGDLVYTVAIYISCSILGIGLLLANRYVYGGELGGPKRYTIASLLVLLWLFYLVMSSLKVYGHIGSQKEAGDC